jgi:hypothetical protein
MLWYPEKVMNCITRVTLNILLQKFTVCVKLYVSNNEIVSLGCFIVTVSLCYYKLLFQIFDCTVSLKIAADNLANRLKCVG